MGIDFCSFTSQVDLVGFVRCVKVLFRVKGGGGRLFYQSRWNQERQGGICPSPHFDFGQVRRKTCSINTSVITDCPSRFSNLPPALRDRRELVVGLEEHKSPLRIMIMD